MSLRIQTNIPALNAHKQLSISSSNMSKSLERLSSGYRINRAADDAAGLAIAGKLRTNIRSFVKAAENTAQATSMVQVAEGAMVQIENIVNRLKELATQAASTNTDADGRARLNDEFGALVSEVNRIADTTKYGESQLINGNFGAAVSGVSATLSADVGLSATADINASGHIGSSGSVYTIQDAGDDGSLSLTNGSLTQTVSKADGAGTMDFDKLGVKITVNSNFDDGTSYAGMVITVTNASQNVQVGTRNESYDKISMSMSDFNTDSTWGTEATDAMDNWAVDSVAEAQRALNSIDTAVEYVTSRRGDLGSLQNRLSYAAANLATTIENTSAAESTIRDVDMAMEMSTFTKNQILMQAGTAMLAQANMAPQQVLGLFG